MQTPLLVESLIEDQRRLETNLIAMMYQYPRYAVKTLNWLQPSTIINERYAKFWGMVREKVTPNMSEYDAGKVVTSAWVGSGLNMNGEFHNVIDMPDMDIESLGDEIRKIQYMQDAASQASEVITAIRHRDITKIRIATKGFETYNNMDSASMDTVDAVSDAFNKAIDDGNLAIPSMIGGVDNAIGGWAIQDATVIAGRPSMGKTAFMLQAARNIAHGKKRAGIFECEMSRIALWARMACPMVGVSWKDVIGGKIITEQKERLKAESRKLADLYRDYLYIDDNSYQTVDTIWEKVIKNELDIIFVDHLGLLKDRQDMKEVKRLGYISAELKSLAKKLDIAVVYLAQLNRGTEMRDKKRPQLADLRDSGEIEQNADTVLMMYRDEYYTEGADTGGVTEIWVRKFRNGLRNSKIELQFDIEREWFESVNTIKSNPNQAYRARMDEVVV